MDGESRVQRHSLICIVRNEARLLLVISCLKLFFFVLFNFFVLIFFVLFCFVFLCVCVHILQSNFAPANNVYFLNLFYLFFILPHYRQQNKDN